MRSLPAKSTKRSWRRTIDAPRRSVRCKWTRQCERLDRALRLCAVAVRVTSTVSASRATSSGVSSFISVSPTVANVVASPPPPPARAGRRRRGAPSRLDRLDLGAARGLLGLLCLPARAAAAAGRVAARVRGAADAAAARARGAAVVADHDGAVVGALHLAAGRLGADGERRAVGEQIVRLVLVHLDRRRVERAAGARAQQLEREPRQQAPRRRHAAARLRQALLRERARRPEDRVRLAGARLPVREKRDRVAVGELAEQRRAELVEGALLVAAGDDGRPVAEGAGSDADLVGAAGR